MQVFTVHPVRHARGVGIPGHQVVLDIGLSQQILVQQARPDQVIGAQQLEGAGHLRGVEIALLPHRRLQHCDLAFVDEQRQFARLLEVHLGCEEGNTGQPVVLLARHGRCRNRQQRPTQAVADRVDLFRAGDVLYCAERSHHAQPTVIFHAQVAFGRARVFPRDHEYRVALPNQIAHQRVFRRQVEDVVLHDPGRHDQQRQRMHVGRGRRVLDQLHQAVAQHHLAGRYGDVYARPEQVAGGRPLAAQMLLPVQEKLRGALRHVGAAGAQRMLQQFRIGRDEIGRRHHVEHLADGEGDHVFMVRGHTAHAEARAVPPLLGQQKALRVKIERPLLPAGIVKTLVLRQRRNRRAWRRSRSLLRTDGVLRQAHPAIAQFSQQFLLLGRRSLQMQHPVRECQSQRGRRYMRGKTTYPCMQQAIDIGARPGEAPVRLRMAGRAQPCTGLAFRELLQRQRHKVVHREVLRHRHGRCRTLTLFPGKKIDPHQAAPDGINLACSSTAARSLITSTSLSRARVMPTNSLRTARSSSASKSISVKITAGADCPLKR